MIRYRLISILIGAGLDCLIGDPQWMPHPVRLMGGLISFLDRLWRRKGETPWESRAKGAVLALVVLTFTIRFTHGILKIFYDGSPIAGVALESVLCCYALAARNLRDSSMKVYDALTEGGGSAGSGSQTAGSGSQTAGSGSQTAGSGSEDTGGSLEKARRAVSMIVGRDTQNLDRSGIIRAAVETVAENTADGVIAPLFYLALGGAVGGMTYKAINTMDSMLGYKNEKYQYFGTAAARLDDIAGFLPARISGLLLVAAAALTGRDAAGAWRIFKRDRYAHKSPNSAQSESAVAGALGVQLAGDAVYGGKIVHKPFIGDPLREIEAEDIRRANKLMYVASGLGLALAAAGLGLWIRLV